MSERRNTPVSHSPDSVALGERVELDDLQSPILLQARAVWAAQKGSRRFPARSEMTPRLMAPFLRNIVLVRVEEGEFEFRIVGDAIVQVQGASFQGMTLSEIDKREPGYGAMLRPFYERVVQRAEPRAYRGRVGQSPGGRSFTHESLLLPLGPNESTVDHILVVGTYLFTMDAPG